jgi:putative hydrolase of the HAD superfamily
MPKRVTAVLFDWDFTLAYTLEQDISQIERTATLFEYEEVVYPVADFRLARQDLLADIALGKANGTIKPQTKQEFIHLYQQLLIRLGHQDTSRDLANRIYAAYGKLPNTLYDDVLPTLTALQKQNIKLGVLSNHIKTIRPVIEKLVGDFVQPQHITISDELRVYKPSKTIFRRAAARLRTDPTNCLYVGDNLHVDAIGAVQQGGYHSGIWLDRQNKGGVHDIPLMVVRINYLSQVLDFIP